MQLNPYTPGGPLLPPTPILPKAKSASASTTRRRPCTGSRKTCRRRELRRRAKKHSRRSKTKKASNYHYNNGNSGSIPDKHEYINELKESLQDLIDMLYAAGRNTEAKEKEELLRNIKY